MMNSFKERYQPHTLRLAAILTKQPTILGCLLVVSFLVTACEQKVGQTQIWYMIGDISNSEIRTIDPLTGQQRTVFHSTPDDNIERPSLSPDGKNIAFVKLTDRGNSVWVVNTDGSNPRQVSDKFQIGGAFWFDANNLIVDIGDLSSTGFDHGQVSRFNLLTDMQYPLHVEGDLYWCSPNKPGTHPEKVALMAGTNPAVGHLELKKNVLQSVVDFSIDVSMFPFLSDPGCLSWSQDGQSVALRAKSTYSTDILLASNQGQSIKRLTDFDKDYGITGIFSHAISPNGHWVMLLTTIVSTNSPKSDQGMDIILVNTENKKMDFLGKWEVQSSDDIVWSPDSRYVAMILIPKYPDQIKGGEVYLINVETKEIKRLTTDGGLKQVFDWR